MKNKLRITLLHNIISPYRLPLYEELSKRFDLTLYFCKETSKDRLWETDLSNYNFKYNILKEFDFGPLYLNYLLPFNLLRNKSDIFMVSECPEMSLSVITYLLYAKLTGKKIIIWAGQTTDDIYFFPGLRSADNLVSKFAYRTIVNVVKVYHKFIYRLGDSFIAYSKKSKEHLMNYGIKDEYIFVGTQVMPSELLPKPTLIKDKTEYKNKKVLLYLGYLNERKGVEFLIKAFKKIKIKDALLLIVGSGNTKDKLVSLAGNNKTIKFIENVDIKTRANYYSIADLFIFPTLFDVWGLVTNEALHYNLPMVISNAAASSELIENNKTGFVVQPRNSSQLQESITKYFSDKQVQTRIKKNVLNFPKEKITSVKNVAETFTNAVNFLYR